MQRRSKHRDGTAASLKTCSMCSCINALSQTADHRPMSLGKGSTQFVRHPKAVVRRPSRADNRNRLLQ